MTSDQEHHDSPPATGQTAADLPVALKLYQHLLRLLAMVFLYLPLTFYLFYLHMSYVPATSLLSLHTGEFLLVMFLLIAPILIIKSLAIDWLPQRTGYQYL